MLSRVLDGDTLVVTTGKGDKISVRLYGIDCPEGRQNFGLEARLATYDQTHGHALMLDLLYEDRYGRNVAIVRFPDSTTLQEKLLGMGAGWVSPRYCKRPECATWKTLERTARDSKTGLWEADQPIPPWEWRKKRKGQRISPS